MIGAQALHATGYAMGIQRDGDVGTGDPDRDAAVIAHFGDGASSQGDVNEAFIFAASYNAPVVFFCQNNQWAISEPIERQSRIPLYQRALGFGFPGVRVDGNDVLATYAVTQAALQRARDGQGPTLVEAYTYRMGAHTTTDDPTRYRLSDDVESWKLKDPIARVEVYLRRNGLVDDAFIDDVKQEADELGHHLREGCKALPDPQPLDMFDHVYAEETEELRVQREGFADYLETFEGATDERDQKITLAKGLNDGPAQGDGGRPQGPHHGRGRRQARRRLPDHRRPAEGLRRGPRHRLPAGRVRHRRHRDRHGAARLPAGGRDPVRRVRLPGVRPDRVPGREDALPLQGPATRSRWSSGSRSAAASARSSTTPRARRRSSRTRPGLKVVACSNPVDGYWMIQQAIACDDPVIFLEPKRQYHADKAELDETATPEPLFTSRVVRAGHRRHRARLRARR